MPETLDHEAADTVPMRHRDLEQIALVALRAGRLLMECGVKAQVVREGVDRISRGLGATQVHVRVGFASLAITVGHGAQTITRMTVVGPHGVNLRLNHALRRLCARAGRGDLTVDAIGADLDRLERETPRHPWPLVCLAVGVACAAFGRLLGVDWIAVAPVLAAGALGQAVRHHLARRGLNAFVTTAVVAFVASALAATAARALGSGMTETAMIAAVLMLVPGVHALNAQTDIMEGQPTLGSARAVSVLMTLVFLTVGVWTAQATLGLLEPGPVAVPPRVLWHQALFGAVASAGFGVLFNFGWGAVAWAAAAGAIALSVRTLGLEAGWSLEAASFVAAAAVAVSVQALDTVPVGVRRAGAALAVAGCIPMIPGSLAAQGIMSLLELTAPDVAGADALLLSAVNDALRVVFTIGAIGAGLTIVTALWRRPDFRP
ncbi:threonine/serine exporter family protein [Roseospira goensis]|uniref:Uncharacterized membrane protein YjjP (DUF1212 family) n=1 Tax=Roseospira goensis TaxID=391922 RepID=A0A7W6RXW8_9PROT|nr:threonine/serine exporter family protein [Roseospira goensis]MBB4285259.1 uncharacterized membrane protein YjjP (DUF1212 family) [Roseospira goensis]